VCPILLRPEAHWPSFSTFFCPSPRAGNSRVPHLHRCPSTFARRPSQSHGCPQLTTAAYHNCHHHPRATVRPPPSPTPSATILRPHSSMNVSQGGQFWLGGDLIWRGGAGGGPASPPQALSTSTLTSSRARTSRLGAPPPLQARLYVPRVALPPPLLQGQCRRY